MPSNLYTTLVVFGLFCHIKYTADNDGITILAVTHVNSSELLNIEYDNVIEDIVSAIHEQHEEANRVDSN